MYKGKAWLRVALPDRPNGSSGWIREDFVRLSTTPWRVTDQPRGAHRHRLSQRAQAAQLHGRDRRRRRPRRAACTRSTRSCRSRTRRASSAPGRCTSRRSRTCCFNYGGGPGRVAIHGRDGTSLADPLGSSRLARLRARRRRQHPLDGARHPARHARADHLRPVTPTGESSRGVAAPMQMRMVAIARFGVLAVAGVAAAAVALPHLLATRPRRSRCRMPRSAVPVFRSASRTCRPASCTCRPRSATAAAAGERARDRPPARSSLRTRCRRG